jgi:hypothetical protein
LVGDPSTAAIFRGKMKICNIFNRSAREVISTGDSHIALKSVFGEKLQSRQEMLVEGTL